MDRRSRGLVSIAFGLAVAANTWIYIGQESMRAFVLMYLSGLLAASVAYWWVVHRSPTG